VTDEQAHALWSYTEGWPAGLRLSTTPFVSGSPFRRGFRHVATWRHRRRQLPDGAGSRLYRR
jgi:hypothetical protein